MTDEREYERTEEVWQAELDAEGFDVDAVAARHREEWVRIDGEESVPSGRCICGAVVNIEGKCDAAQAVQVIRERDRKIAKWVAWLRSVADQWASDEALLGSAAARDVNKAACDIFRMAADDLAREVREAQK